MSFDLFDASSEDNHPPNLNDITPWLVTYVRANFAEHQSKLFDETPGQAIEAIIQWTLGALVVNAVDDDDDEGSDEDMPDYPKPGDDNAQET